MVSAVLLLVVGTMVQGRDLISGLLITEWLLVLVPTYLFMKIFKIPLSEIRLKPLKFNDGILVVLITVFLYPVIIFLNITFLFFLKLFIDFEFNSIPLPNDFNEYLLYIPVMVLSAGICEEFLFRGVIMSRFKIFGRRNAIILSAVLFGVFHFNFQNIVGPVILGLIFGYFVYRTGSLFAAMIGHITHNMISLTIAYLSLIIAPQTTGVESPIDAYDLIGSIIFVGIIAMACIFMVKFLMNKLSDKEMKTELNVEYTFIAEIGMMPWVPVIAVMGAYLVINTLVIIL